jgi:hypothetical protein
MAFIKRVFLTFSISSPGTECMMSASSRFIMGNARRRIWDAAHGQLFVVSWLMILFKHPKFQYNSWLSTHQLRGTGTDKMLRETLRCITWCSQCRLWGMSHDRMACDLHLTTFVAISTTCCQGISCAGASHGIFSSPERRAREEPSSHSRAPHRLSRWPHSQTFLHGSGKHEWIRRIRTLRCAGIG